ncbi:MAG: GvpL/GvpF family gas vesicle protein [Deltaproteobacteria bacterium]|nr:GvpL/GvpF family gas vesicle protein [Deltaproteobacteria bacterium]
MIEVDVTAVWTDIANVARGIAEEDIEIKSLKDAVRAMPVDGSLTERIKIGSLIKSALDRKRVEILQHTLGYLSDIVVKAKEQEIVECDDIFNCAFLIEKRGEADFFSRLDQLNLNLKEQLRFKCVAPLPPYAFCIFEVIRIGSDKVNKARILLDVDNDVHVSKMKEIYLKKVLECHPDHDLEDPLLESRFKELTEAYKVLSMVYNEQGCGLGPVGSKNFFYVNQARA